MPDGLLPDHLVPAEVMRRIHIPDGQDPHVASMAPKAWLLVGVVHDVSDVPVSAGAKTEFALALHRAESRHQKHPAPGSRAGLPEDDVLRSVRSKQCCRNRRETR